MQIEFSFVWECLFENFRKTGLGLLSAILMCFSVVGDTSSGQIYSADSGILSVIFRYGFLMTSLSILKSLLRNLLNED